MSFFLNRFSTDDNGRIRIDDAFAGTAVYHDGLVYSDSDADRLVVNYAGTPVEWRMQGLGQTATGELCIVDASGGLPADTFWQSGLPISAAEGRLCVDASNAVAFWLSGVPFTTVGAVAVDTGSLPSNNNRITGDSETRITADGDTRVWV